MVIEWTIIIDILSAQVGAIIFESLIECALGLLRRKIKLYCLNCGVSIIGSREWGGSFMFDNDVKDLFDVGTIFLLIAFVVDLIMESEVWSREDDLVMDGVESCPCEDNLDMEGVDTLAFVVDLIMESEVWSREDDLVMDGIESCPREDKLDMEGAKQLYMLIVKISRRKCKNSISFLRELLKHYSEDDVVN